MNVRGFKDLRGDGGDGDDRPMQHYTGGESSGLNVQDPRRQADEIMESAKRMGAISADQYEREKEEGDQAVEIYFWSNGFSVEDGPLRTIEDESNREFLEDINRGLVPREFREKYGYDVRVSLMNRTSEPYKAPKPKPKPSFSGVGLRLDPIDEQTIDNAEIALEPIVVDESLPVTKVRVRMSDGSQVEGMFNEHHTVGVLRAFVYGHRISREMESNFTMSIPYPRKVLKEDDKTLKEENLCQSTIIIKDV